MGEPKNLRGLVVARGRLPEPEWKRLTGISKLPILLAWSPLARLIVQHVHCKDHRCNVGALVAMTRRYAWVTGARRLVRAVVKSCMVCRLHRRQVQGQVMADLPNDTLEHLRAFEHLQLDLMGPFNVKGIGGYGRKTFKVWGTVFVCSISKVVSAWVIMSYSTESLLMALTSHSSIYGAPRMIVTDRGSQIVAAARDQPDWSQVQLQTAASGTAWRFIPPGAPWHNGLVERVIGLMKDSLLRQVHAGAVLDFVQLQVLVHRVAYTLNERPLSARSFTAEDFCAITPIDLLLGAAPARTAQQIMQQVTQEDTIETLAARVGEVEECLACWWSRYFKDVFPSLVPRAKWKQEQRSVKVGDIILIMFRVKYAKDKFRLCRILCLLPDHNGVVRSVMVGLRDRQKAAREALDQCKAGMRIFQAPVQRLVVVLPAEEQPQEVLDLIEGTDPQDVTQGEQQGVDIEDELQEEDGDVDLEAQDSLPHQTEGPPVESPEEVLLPQPEISPDVTPHAPLSIPEDDPPPSAQALPRKHPSPTTAHPPRLLPRLASGQAKAAPPLPQRTTWARARAVSQPMLKVTHPGQVEDIIDI